MSHSAPDSATCNTGFCSERVGSSDSCTGADQVSASRRENHTLMSGTPSWVPANHTHASVPSGSTVRLAAWFCTWGGGNNAWRRPGSAVARTVPSVVVSEVLMSAGTPPSGRRSWWDAG